MRSAKRIALWCGAIVVAGYGLLVVVSAAVLYFSSSGEGPDRFGGRAVLMSAPSPDGALTARYVRYSRPGPDRDGYLVEVVLGTAAERRIVHGPLSEDHRGVSLDWRSARHLVVGEEGLRGEELPIRTFAFDSGVEFTVQRVERD